jgi:hypothetical protein
MTALLAILLFLRVIFAGQTLPARAVRDLEQANQPAIQLVKDNAVLYDHVQQVYHEDAESITIIDQTCND